MQKNKVLLSGILAALLLTVTLSASAATLNKKINLPNPAVVGKVTAISGSTLTVERNAGAPILNNNAPRKAKPQTNYTVATNSATTFKMMGKDATLADIKIGYMVVAQGELNSVGDTITAKNINISVPPMPAFSGKVSVVNGGNFDITKNDAGASPEPITYTVSTSAATIFKMAGKSAGLTDVAVGKMVIVQGSFDKTTNTISAANITIVSARPNPEQTQTEKKSPKNGLDKNGFNFGFGASVSTAVFNIFGSMKDVFGGLLKK